MGKILKSDGFEKFLNELQNCICSRGDVPATVSRALAMIAEELSLGKVTANLTIPKSKLRESIDNQTKILFHGESAVSSDGYEKQFVTGDGGKALFTYYAVDGYTWTEDEKKDLDIIAKQIFAAFSHYMMSGILEKTMFLDLSVGIPNITGFMKYASGLFGQGKLQEYDAFYLNIHNFKYVNKVLPYEQTDSVMAMYAQKLAGAVKEDEMVARLGGDNYVALVRKENVEAFLWFVSGVNIIYENEGREKAFNFSATVGGGHLENLQNVGELMLRISVAYQIARKRQSSTVVYYSDELYKEVMWQKATIAGFEEALKNNEFVVYYQPKVTTADKKICGAEALVRWFRKGKLVPPMEFIPILEKDGSICMLDFYMLDKVCDMLRRSREQGVPLTRVSVNFSRKHMEDDDLVKKIIAVIDKYQLPHEYFEIELTESEDYRDYSVMSKVITGLRAAGISTSIDDFGTGYSSLNMVKMTHVDLLKIDKSFVPAVEEYDEKQRDVLMFESIARMAKELGIQVIVEGVETKPQYEYLKQAGCDMVQGYYFDRPMPEADFWERMRVGKYE